jgi:hypothetical protein
MHGLIFETSVCYWQNQPGCYRVLWVSKINLAPVRSTGTKCLSFPRFGNHDMFGIISTEFLPINTVLIGRILRDLDALSNVLSPIARPARSRTVLLHRQVLPAVR